MPERYWIGAAVSVAVGAAVAATAVLATSASAKGVQPAVVSPARQADEAVRALWRTKPVEQVFPATVTLGSQYVRLGIADPAACAVLPADFLLELASEAPGTSCVKVLRATYTDITQTVFATVGVVVIGGEASARDKVWRQWTPDEAAKQPDTMPDVVPFPRTVAAGLTDTQRVAWDSQASNDGSYLIYVVTAFGDGRAGSTDTDLRTGLGKDLVADSPPVQAASGLSQIFANEFTNTGKG
ncbi:hypothetical protein Caci_5488 [Catenulispora acidiphila DSM 44928]|uniref:PknH-like extracellular domain-containing protein n=1 Tax=Catenulispora acidiphila (strain DSM 44928 / JCM 14897 / NBRC 102108 / NRRL B-24433 / ID139908) TaxID=479433 RepID=C7Q9K1_CATAD|nr:hypothetical protein [Catenulispora acidiphila]ACU74347.1 hypothetical protein Caci_5488 [Catenulispora acidiphila DSM 44928]